MDLLQSVRKEGSRGGRADFKWEDVKQDSQRENYLGHSLMAPVGRWQKGRDLNWYAKPDTPATQSAAESLTEEKRRIKEAEEDAMLAAMGLPVPQRVSTNVNLTPLGEKSSQVEVKKASKGTATDEGDTRAGNLVGYGGYNGQLGAADDREGDMLSGDGLEKQRPNGRSRGDERGRHGQQERINRRRREYEGRERNRRKRSRSQSRRRHRRSRSRSSGRERDKDLDGQWQRQRQRQRHRSKSNSRRLEEERSRRRRRHLDRDDEDRSRAHSQDRAKYERYRRRSRSPLERSDGHRRR